MQRLVVGLGRGGVPLAVAGAGAAAHHHAQQPAQSGQPTPGRALQEEELDDFQHVFEAPIQRSEVVAAIGDIVPHARPLLAAGAAPAVPLQAPAPRHLIQEVDGESEASSEGGAVNELMHSVESVRPLYVAHREAAAPEETALDLLASTITNVLNDELVMQAIQARLLEDPAFAEFVRTVSPADLQAYPLAAHPLLLGAPSADDAASEAGSSRGGGATGNPLLDALHALQRGLGLAAIKLGEACVHLGHFLRGVGENLSRALAALEGGSGVGPDGRPRPAVALIITKAAIAVGVVVLTRRVALARVVMA